MQPKHPDGGGSVLTRLLRWLSPVGEATSERLTEEHWEDVRQEFKIHQAVAEVICIASLIGGFFVPLAVAPPMQVWDIPIGFAAMVCMPLLYILFVCALKGFHRSYSRFADYSTRKYAIPWNAQLAVYLFIISLGVAAILGRVFFPFPIG